MGSAAVNDAVPATSTSVQQAANSAHMTASPRARRRPSIAFATGSWATMISSELRRKRTPIASSLTSTWFLAKTGEEAVDEGYRADDECEVQGQAAHEDPVAQHLAVAAAACARGRPGRKAQARDEDAVDEERRRVQQEEHRERRRVCGGHDQAAGQASEAEPEVGRDALLRERGVPKMLGNDERERRRLHRQPHADAGSGEGARASACHGSCTGE
jgi:hypothetical protein